MTKALVTGATGFIGSRLVAELRDPVVLSRSAEGARKRLGVTAAYPWNAEGDPPPPEAFAGIDTVYHLAGESIAARRWSPAFKKRIRDSRVLGTQRLVETLTRLEARPRVLVAASAMGYYGSRGDEIIDEGSSRGEGFLVDVCDEWERAAGAAEALGVRVVRLRIGLVLGPGGGALEKMLPPFRLGMGGVLGNGRQWMSWIHLDDMIRLIRFAADRDDLEGPLNAVAPNPVTNREFTKTLGRVLRRPTLFAVPAAALRVAVGEMAQELLASLRVVPRAVTEAGFEFRYPELEAALREILGAGPRTPTRNERS